MKNSILSNLLNYVLKNKIDIDIESNEDSEIEGVEFLTFNESTLNYYRKKVKGNEDISDDQARRKMTRNMLLAYPYKRESSVKKHPRTWYSYGSLRFIVKDNKVTSLINHQRVFKAWVKDWDKYKELNARFDIEEKYIK